MERARKERKPDQANFIQPIVGLRPFNANLEYRAAGINAPASSHDKDAELFYVVEGAGTVVTGGTLKDERRTNPENLTGTAIEGGTSRKLAKGDWVLVPEKTPHWFTQVEGALVLMSLHLPPDRVASALRNVRRPADRIAFVVSAFRRTSPVPAGAARLPPTISLSLRRRPTCTGVARNR